MVTMIVRPEFNASELDTIRQVIAQKSIGLNELEVLADEALRRPGSKVKGEVWASGVPFVEERRTNLGESRKKLHTMDDLFEFQSQYPAPGLSEILR